MSEIKPRQCPAGIYEWGAVDCDAPFCGCNPAWTVALDGAREAGWSDSSETQTLISKLAQAESKMREIHSIARRGIDEWPFQGASLSSLQQIERISEK